MEPRPEVRKSLKKQMIELLDQFLLGYISGKELINATVPMMMLSANKRGRKNYIEKYLIELSGKEASEVSRDYVYAIRESITGDAVNTKDRKQVFKRTLRKLIERYLFDEIDTSYFLSVLFDLAVENDADISTEKDIQQLLDRIQALNFHAETAALAGSSPEAAEASLVEMVTAFYQEYYRSLWDE